MPRQLFAMRAGRPGRLVASVHTYLPRATEPPTPWASSIPDSPSPDEPLPVSYQAIALYTSAVLLAVIAAWFGWIAAKHAYHAAYNNYHDLKVDIEHFCGESDCDGHDSDQHAAEACTQGYEACSSTTSTKKFKSTKVTKSSKDTKQSGCDCSDCDHSSKCVCEDVAALRRDGKEPTKRKAKKADECGCACQNVGCCGNMSRGEAAGIKTLGFAKGVYQEGQAIWGKDGASDAETTETSGKGMIWSENGRKVW